MNLRVLDEVLTDQALEAHAAISIAFTVSSRLKVELMADGLNGLRLVEEPVDRPWVKDYDAETGEAPGDWAKRWDLTRWRLISAFDDDQRIGGAVVARHSGDMWFLRGREDMAALWDIRVDPAYRRSGVGRALFEAAANWARRQGCRWLKIETQNTNVAACRFYAAMGARLGGIDRFAYANMPDEVEIDWYLEL